MTSFREKRSISERSLLTKTLSLSHTHLSARTDRSILTWCNYELLNEWIHSDERLETILLFFCFSTTNNPSSLSPSLIPCWNALDVIKSALKCKEKQGRSSFSNVRSFLSRSFVISLSSGGKKCWEDVIRRCINLVSHPFFPSLRSPYVSCSLVAVRWWTHARSKKRERREIR